MAVLQSVPGSPSWPSGSIAAVIFDMDGLLMSTELFWQLAERQTFARVGIAITGEMAMMTQAMTTAQATRYWYQYRPWLQPSLEAVESEVIERVANLVARRGRAMPGVYQVIASCLRRGWRFGLASNSPSRVIDAVLSKLGLREVYEVIVSAEQVSQGKPAPCVFLEAARRMQVDPRQCIVLEDSAAGLQAAYAAGMTAIAIPSRGWKDELAAPLPLGFYNSLTELASALDSMPCHAPACSMASEHSAPSPVSGRTGAF